MLDFLLNQIIFYASIALVMFIPGYFLLLAVFGKSQSLSTLERFVISFGLSIIIVDFIAFTFDKLRIPLTAWTSALGILAFSLICFGIYKFKKNPLLPPGKGGRRPDEEMSDNNLFSFSKNQFILILLLLFLTVFIKSSYLSGTIAPTSTDMGHHMYWAKWMTENHRLTDYEGMPDFIIGEHIIFSEIALISRASFFSAFPPLVLFLINLLSILAVFILVLRVFENLPPHQFPENSPLRNVKNFLNPNENWCGGKNIAILTLLFLGVLYAVSSPQEKFVSGGVIGNIMGNFFLPLAFYFYYRAMESILHNPPLPSGEDVRYSGQERVNTVSLSKSFLSLAIFVTSGLFFTHHLTSFILIFIALLLVPLFIIANYADIENIFKKSWEVILSPLVIGTLTLGLFYFFFVFAPTYVSGSAVDTAVGAATKSTRVGLSITNVKQTVGEGRLALGFLGLFILLLSFRRKNLGYSIFAAWTLMLFIMSVRPNWLFIDLPSSRIGNYMSYPLAILSAYGFYSLFRPDSCRFLFGKVFCAKPQNALPQKLFKGFFAIVLTFVIAGGLSDSASAFKVKNNFQEAIQTFHASAYLVPVTTDADIILKDHNYLTADSWIKLFFMKGYKYPQSRGLFSRYESTGNRRDDTCTLDMISNPGGSEAQKCFSDTKTNIIMVNPLYDSPQFQRLPDFDQIYMNDEVAVYYKK